MYRTAFCVYTCKSVLATTGQYSVHCLCQGKTLIGALASFPGLPPRRHFSSHCFLQRVSSYQEINSLVPGLSPEYGKRKWG